MKASSSHGTFNCTKHLPTHLAKLCLSPQMRKWFPMNLWNCHTQQQNSNSAQLESTCHISTETRFRVCFSPILYWHMCISKSMEIIPVDHQYGIITITVQQMCGVVNSVGVVCQQYSNPCWHLPLLIPQHLFCPKWQLTTWHVNLLESRQYIFCTTLCAEFSPEPAVQCPHQCTPILMHPCNCT